MHTTYTQRDTRRAPRTQDGRISIIKAEHHRQLQAASGQDTVAKQLFHGLDVTSCNPNNARHIEDILNWGSNRKAVNEGFVFPYFPQHLLCFTPSISKNSLTNNSLLKRWLAMSWKWHLSGLIAHGINIDIKAKEMFNIRTGANREIFYPGNVLHVYTSTKWHKLIAND